MLYRCFNCEENVEIPDVSVTVAAGETCGMCGTDLNLNVYELCPGCNMYFIKTFNRCVHCDRPRDGIMKFPEANYLFVETESDYSLAVGHLYDMDVIALDTEGNSLDTFANDLLLVQLGTTEIAYIFGPRWQKRLSKESFWSDPEKLFIIQNAKFDYKVLRYSLGIEIASLFDTMIAERMITCGILRENSLKAIVGRYYAHDMDKEMSLGFQDITPQNFNEKITKEHIVYSALDVQVLPQIYEMQKWRLQHANMWELAQVEFDVCRAIAEMELNGIYVDTQKWNENLENCKYQKDQILEDIRKILRENELIGMFSNIELTLNSPLKLRQLLSSFHLQIDSTSDAELSQIKHPLVERIREYRCYGKQISSFGSSFLECVRPETSRVHPTFQQIGADTGRFSCNKPNLQQVPATLEYRGCFRAPAGRKLVTCDYSQQELRLLASFSKDEKFIKTYKKGADLHTETASMMFNIPSEKVEKEHHRQIAKKINFGLVYGRGPRSLAMAIGVNEGEARKLIEKYFAQFPSIRDWLDNAARFAQKKGYSKTIMNRRRYYKMPKKASPDYREMMAAIGRKGKNTPIQGSAVDMMKLALVLVFENLKNSNLDAFLVNTVHDEIVVECAEEAADQVAKIVQDSMEEAGRKLVSNVPIIAEACVEDYWTH